MGETTSLQNIPYGYDTTKNSVDKLIKEAQDNNVYLNAEDARHVIKRDMETFESLKSTPLSGCFYDLTTVYWRQASYISGVLLNQNSYLNNEKLPSSKFDQIKKGIADEIAKIYINPKYYKNTQNGRALNNLITHLLRETNDPVQRSILESLQKDLKKALDYANKHSRLEKGAAHGPHKPEGGAIVVVEEEGEDIDALAVLKGFLQCNPIKDQENFDKAIEIAEESGLWAGKEGLNSYNPIEPHSYGNFDFGTDGTKYRMPSDKDLNNQRVNDNEKVGIGLIYAEFKKYDPSLTDKQIAGIIGNMMQESTLNQNAVGGLMQYSSSRLKQFQAEYNEEEQKNYKNQFEFMFNHELFNEESEYYEEYKRFKAESKTVVDAAKDWRAFFEKNKQGTGSDPERVLLAKKAFIWLKIMLSRGISFGNNG